jgi:diguanylate cyclase (GGDEF)-like protein
MPQNRRRPKYLKLSGEFRNRLLELRFRKEQGFAGINILRGSLIASAIIETFAGMTPLINIPDAEGIFGYICAAAGIIAALFITQKRSALASQAMVLAVSAAYVISFIAAEDAAGLAAAGVSITGALAFMLISRTKRNSYHKTRYAKQMKSFLLKDGTAGRDPLTGAVDKKTFLARIEKFLNGTGCCESEISLILLDIDRFDQVNSNFGQEIGDMVLKDLAHLCMSLIRPSDFMGRTGGQEFAIFLTDADKEGAFKLAERIRGAVENSRFQTQKGSVTVTLSIGIAGCGKAAVSFETLSQRAKDALKKAKDSGRNKTVIA